jgi:hypothetical protein
MVYYVLLWLYQFAGTNKFAVLINQLAGINAG